MSGDATGPLGTRREILATALRLFLARGYDATSLRQIAEELHLTKAALYYHFPAKEHLVIELTRPFLDDLGVLVADMRESTAGSEPRAVLGRYLDLFVRHYEVVSLLARDPGPHHHPDVGERIRTLVAAVQAALTGPDPALEQRVRIACALGAVHAVPTLELADLTAARETILDCAVGALSPDVRPRAPRTG